MKRFPVALDLQGRRCVVVGGGSVGARKVTALLECGAQVVVVAPDLRASLSEQVGAGVIEHIAQPFAAPHLIGAFLCIVATDQASVNAAAARAAREMGVLLNVAAPTAELTTDGETEKGDFVTMAAVRRGDLLIAITTGGAGPSLSAQLRRQMETQFGPEWSLYTELLGEMRDTLKRHKYRESDMTAAMRRLVENDAVRTALTAGNHEAARLLALATVGLAPGDRNEAA